MQAIRTGGCSYGSYIQESAPDISTYTPDVATVAIGCGVELEVAGSESAG